MSAPVLDEQKIEDQSQLLQDHLLHLNPAMLPSVPNDGSDPNEYVQANQGDYTMVLGRLPLKAPNVRFGHEEEDIAHFINGPKNISSTLLDWCGGILCCLTGVGACYLLNKTFLVNQGQIAFSNNNGTFEVILPGRHVLLNPLNSLQSVVDVSSPVITCGPITIVRVPQGSLGFGQNNAKQEILLPGLHIRNSGQFVYKDTFSSNSELIEFGPIKILTVQSGFVRVCFINGKVVIYPEGRYAVNHPTFQVGGKINIQQQNMKFNAHRVMLDGGINVLVEGLLTFRIVNVEMLIKQIGVSDVVKAIEHVSEAEISRVFSSVHLEAIASVHRDRDIHGEAAEPSAEEVETRSKICQCIIAAVKPIVQPWGVQIVNFQINSLTLADEIFAKEYESASLAVSKAKAGLRATAAENEIMITKAKAASEATRIQAEGQKQAIIIKASAEAEAKSLSSTADARATVIIAEADAQARKLEAASRNEAAEIMKNEFARTFALTGQQVQFAGALKANSLTVLSESAIAKPIVSSFLTQNPK